MSEANKTDNDEIGTWNYRIVNVKSENGGADWYCLQEVYYRGGKPMGYGEPCLGSETMESFMLVWQMLEQALKKPPLQEEDFKENSDTPPSEEAPSDQAATPPSDQAAEHQPTPMPKIEEIAETLAGALQGKDWFMAMLRDAITEAVNGELSTAVAEEIREHDFSSDIDSAMQDRDFSYDIEAAVSNQLEDMVDEKLEGLGDMVDEKLEGALQTKLSNVRITFE